MTLTSVLIEQGELTGVPNPTGDVVSFKGVPYAAPPIGALRWKRPRPAEKWNGARPADRFGPACPQLAVRPDSLLAGGQGPQDEDCLYLNVWTAASDPAEGRPVAVFLHLGGFRYGSGAVPGYDGEGLAQSGLVVITINYRLNRFGFLAHPALSRESGSGASGNYGLYDQLAALEWIQANVSAFGGDPSCVTVFGVSAGSCSINLLMATTAARGLFHRAIGQSGAQLGTVAQTSNVADQLQNLDSAERTGLAVAAALGAGTLDELRSVPAQALLTAPITPPGAVAWRRRGSDGAFYRGSLDSGYPIVDGVLLAEPPLDVYARLAQMRIPLMTGSVANEGSSSASLLTLDSYHEDSRLEYGDLYAEFLRVYPADTDDQAAEVSAASFADRMSTSGNWTWARLQSWVAPTFYYHFARVPPVPQDGSYAERAPGAYHGADIPYVFGNLSKFSWAWTDADTKLSDIMSAYWVNFATAGTPNGVGLPYWDPFSTASPAAMRFDASVGMDHVPNRARLDFWDRFYGREKLLR